MTTTMMMMIKWSPDFPETHTESSNVTICPDQKEGRILLKQILVKYFCGHYSIE